MAQDMPAANLADLTLSLNFSPAAMMMDVNMPWTKYCFIISTAV